jgi:hypothetical protein
LVEIKEATGTPPEKISDNQKKRGKPMPTLLHGAIQFNMGFTMKTAYPSQYCLVNEVTLNTQPFGSTPDLLIYAQHALDFKNEPSRPKDAPLLRIEILSASKAP